MKEESINLATKEFELLSFLAKNPDKVFSYEELYRFVWDSKSLGDYRTVMVHISNIRRKIEKNSREPLFIQTVKGVGYKFCSNCSK